MTSWTSWLDRFGFFDRSQEYAVTFGDLPHWEQPGATYFITFRTVDSLPDSVLRLWRRERDDYLARELAFGGTGAWHQRLATGTLDQQFKFQREFLEKIEAELDLLAGDCLLRLPDIAGIVADSLLRFDGVRYHLGDFIVMPNHVHLLVCFLPGTGLLKQCQAWKHFTAREINKRLGRSGHFWQHESFDHLVRDPDQFTWYRQYMADNPAKAGLHSGEYLHHRMR